MKKVKVEMLTSIAGGPDLRYGPEAISFSIGEIVDLHPDQARAWIAGGLAKAVTGPSVVSIPETTSIEPPETTVLPEGKPKKASRMKESEQPGEHG